MSLKSEWRSYFFGMHKRGTHMNSECNVPFDNVRLVDHWRQVYGIFVLSHIINILINFIWNILHMLEIVKVT
jgi:hypothetical protein